MTLEKALRCLNHLMSEYDYRGGGGIKSVLVDATDRAAMQHVCDELAKRPAVATVAAVAAAPVAAPDPKIAAVVAALNGTGGPRSKLDAIEKIVGGDK